MYRNQAIDRAAAPIEISVSFAGRFFAMLITAHLTVTTPSAAQETPPNVGKPEGTSSSTKAATTPRSAESAKENGTNSKANDVIIISPQPNQTRKSSHKIEIVKHSPKPSSNRNSVAGINIPGAGAVGATARNSIGQPLPRPLVPEPSNPSSLQNHPPALQGGASSITVKPAGAEGAVSGNRNTNSIMSAPTMNRSAITGTGIMRTGHGPGIVSGTKNVASGTISGISIKPRH